MRDCDRLQKLPEDLALGLYEQVVDRRLRSALESIEHLARVECTSLDEGDSHSVLAQHMAALFARALKGVRGKGCLAKQIDLCNCVVALLSQHEAEMISPEQAVAKDAQRLLAVLSRQPSLAEQPLERPGTPLSVGCLLTGSGADPSLVSQLRKELLTSDQVDVLCSFIKWSGIRVLQEELRHFARQPGRVLRIITTSYLGATDAKAVEFLAGLPNARLKVSYDARRTRLHAKAYMFHRATGFGTAYVGSSNLSSAALTDGLEWNVKISQWESSHLWHKLCGTFDAYWNDPEFASYTTKDRERLRIALLQEQGYGVDAIPAFQFDIHPYPYQQEILDQLAADRAYRGRTRNLVVAATGTGKTVVAAFDYKRFEQTYEAEHAGRTARLLFVAHREEILKQSRECFRAVLRDQNFGDLLVGQHRPDQLDHLFVSIQSYNSHNLSELVAPDFYDFVVIDEFHHAEAPSYLRLLEHIQPCILLGLTATPERADGLDVLRHFGGHVSAEIRLPAAINRKLLCPFQYFGVSDCIDLSALAWKRGGYLPRELDRAYSGNDARADLVVRSVQEKLVDPRQARGLGFCVSVAHAVHMAEYFRRCGIPAEALSGTSPNEQRQSVQQRLTRREINFIFVVDLYNEGIDIPQIDTILLLRPTESLTVFLQQLGRGLRLWDGKDCLTVLDFIGQAHRKYNWETRFRALMDQPKRRIDQEIEDGCLHLPLGCVIRLERKAQAYVLDNIRSALSQSRTGLLRRIADFEEETGQRVSLAGFLDYYGLDIDEVYRRGTWSRLCVQAGIRADFSDLDEQQLAKGFRRFAHISGAGQIERLLSLLAPGGNGTLTEGMDALTERAVLMLHVALWKDWRPGGIVESIDRIRANPTLHGELLELLRYRHDKLDSVPPRLDLPFLCPLELGGRYTRDEILVALGCWTLAEQREVREGVLHLPNLPADVLFVTLKKTESEYSPTTLYEDYAISDELFHWQSQSTTSAQSPTGQRYVHHSESGHTVLMFVREEKRHNGLARPYDFVGPVTYENHTGSRPMSIVWRLRHPIPARLLPIAMRLSAA